MFSTGDFYTLVKNAVEVEIIWADYTKINDLVYFLGFCWKCIKWLFEQIWYLQWLQISNSSFVINSLQLNPSFKIGFSQKEHVHSNWIGEIIPINLSNVFQLDQFGRSRCWKDKLDWESRSSTANDFRSLPNFFLEISFFGGLVVVTIIIILIIISISIISPSLLSSALSSLSSSKEAYLVFFQL